MAIRDTDVSFMVNTTVKYLVESVRASEASPDAQKQFSEMILLSGFYDLWTRYLDPAISQALRQAVDSLRQDTEPRTPEGWVDAEIPLLPGFTSGMPDQRLPIVPSYRWQWSYDSSGTAFSGDAATSSSGVALHRSPENESPHKTTVQGPSSTSCHG